VNVLGTVQLKSDHFGIETAISSSIFR